MEFLVRIDVTLPPTMARADRDELLAAENARGHELLDAGSIRDIWRIPGGLRNVGVWVAEDATALHDLIASLPLFPYLSFHGDPEHRARLDAAGDPEVYVFAPMIAVQQVTRVYVLLAWLAKAILAEPALSCPSCCRTASRSGRSFD